MMGCGTSSSAQTTPPHLDDADSTENLGHMLATESAFAGLSLKETNFDAYQRLDDSIQRLEQLCPGPRLATVDAWTEHLQQIRPVEQSLENRRWTEVEPLEEDEDEVRMSATASAAHLDETLPVRQVQLAVADRSLDMERAAIVRLAVQLNVALDVQRARRNETHLAEVSVRHMERIERELHEDILGHTQQRAAHLLELYARLRRMYDEQDGLLASITAGSYSSPTEEGLDHRLDAARQMRDKLGAVAEQWRIAGNLLRTGAKEAIRANEAWSLVVHSKLATDRIQLALDTQAALQAALIAIDYAHKALPHVDFPHITRRRIVATRHASEYVLTDMADAARAAHTAAVVDAFRAGVEETHRWLHETFRRTLRTNLGESEADVVRLAKALRAERSRYMRASDVAQRMYARPGAVEESRLVK